jgi:hypothetical protein
VTIASALPPVRCQRRFRTSGACKLSATVWCGRPDSNRHSDFSPRDFLTRYGFRRLAFAPMRSDKVCGLDYPFTVAGAEAFALGAARLVSTPSHQSFDQCAWLGIACYRFPRIWAVLLPRFPGGHSIFLSPLRLPVPPRPRLAASSTVRAPAESGLVTPRLSQHHGPNGHPIRVDSSDRNQDDPSHIDG